MGLLDDRSGGRQPLDLRSPLDGKPIVADLEHDPLADYVVSCGRLRKFDNARYRVRSSVRRSAILVLAPVLGCALPHYHRAEILAGW